MAISILRTTANTNTYDNISKGGIDNVITAYSTEYANAGFRYWVTLNMVTISGNVITTLYIPPNPQGQGIINLRPHIINSVPNKTLIDISLAGPYIHNPIKSTGDAVVENDAMNGYLIVKVWEAWDVAGVFTKDPGVKGSQTLEMMVFQGWSNTGNFYVENCAARLTAGFVDYDRNTFYQRLASKVPLSFRAKAIMVPTYEDVFGIICTNADNGTYSGNHDGLKQFVHINFYQVDGTLISTDTSIGVDMIQGGMAFIPAHWNNISDIIGIPANTAFYTLQLKDIYDSLCSEEFLFYIEDIDCRYEPIHIGWIGKLGGWNYFTFTKKSENSIDIERTEYKKPYGNYATLGTGLIETPGMLSTDWNEFRQNVSRENMVTKYLTVTSDWISEAEFAYLETLMVADVVHWVYVEEEVPIPMIVTENSYIMKKERNTTKYNITIKFKYAQDYLAIAYTPTL